MAARGARKLEGRRDSHFPRRRSVYCSGRTRQFCNCCEQRPAQRWWAMIACPGAAPMPNGSCRQKFPQRGEPPPSVPAGVLEHLNPCQSGQPERRAPARQLWPASRAPGFCQETHQRWPVPERQPLSGCWRIVMTERRLWSNGAAVWLTARWTGTVGSSTNR